MQVPVQDGEQMQHAHGQDAPEPAEAEHGQGEGGPLDLLAAGQLFLDVLYGVLPNAPELGQELFTPRVDLRPGGIANFSYAAAALGARAGIGAVIGDGPASRFVRELMESEGIDTSRMVHAPGWDVPVTSALSYDGDRALVTGGSAEPVELHAHLNVQGAAAVALHLQLTDIAWLPAATAPVFADVGWDASGQWDRAMLRHLEYCEGFLPNADEAQAYTRTDSPPAAARALSELVPITVVTCGGDGAIAIDSRHGIEVSVPALDLGPVDTTGAGDTFGAAFILAVTHGWDLRDALEFASLTATARAAGVAGAAVTPSISTLAGIAGDHGLAVAERLATPGAGLSAIEPA